MNYCNDYFPHTYQEPHVKIFKQWTSKMFSDSMFSTMEIEAILPIIQIVLAVLLTVAILIQQSEAGAGGAFGGSDSVSAWRTRRGFEKFLFIGTIILAFLFIASAVLALSLSIGRI